MKDWRGKWALITGASAGIGVALAEELASGGTNLVLTARRKDRLAELARRLTATHKINSELFPADLADSNAPEMIFSFAREKGIEIDLLINNAGFGQYGEFPSIEKQRLLDMVQVNCHAVVHLTRAAAATFSSSRQPLPSRPYLIFPPMRPRKHSICFLPKVSLKR